MNILLYLLLAAELLILSHGAGPTPNLMKTAYCACICCEKNEEVCYRHPVIEPDYKCQSDFCSDEFCVKWKEAKCSTSCYCSKCKENLLGDNMKCALHKGIEPGCDCVNLDEITCDDNKNMDPPEIADAMKEYRRMKENKHCLIPCFCSKCKKQVPLYLKQDCNKIGPPTANCTCENTICPTDEDLERFRQLTDENSETLANSSDEELNAFNEQLKPHIDAGRASPVNADGMKAMKCKLQCMCDKCQSNSMEMESNCNRLLKTREQNCPACSNDIQCPQDDPEVACKLYCFCKQCKDDLRMPPNLKLKCENVIQETKETCPCKEKMDCNKLSHMPDIPNIDDQKSQVTSEDGKPRPGKLKQKKKIWDEL